MNGDALYEGVSTARLIDQIARQRGWDPSRYAVAQEELERMCQLANQALERAWRFAPWPFLTLTARVAYRPEWSDAAEYSEGEQVLHGGSHYWEAVRDGVTSEPGTEEGAGDWTPCEAWMVPGISYARHGIDEIDLARGVYALDPDRRADALPLPASRVAFGCVVRRRPDDPFVPRPYVRFRPVPPRLSVTPWSAAQAYETGALAMRGGESYEARGASQGVAPALGDPASDAVWAIRRCPRAFESYVVQSAAAELATDDDAQAARRRRVDEELQFLANSMLRQGGDAARAVTRVFR